MLASAAAAAQAVAPKPAASYALDAGHTFVHWEVLHLGTSTTRGRFDRATGSVRFDARAKLIDIGITVDTASVTSGVAVLDSLLRGDAMLASGAKIGRAHV